MIDAVFARESEMPRRPASKKIHYLQAIFGADHRRPNLAEYLRRSLAALGSVAATEIPMAQYGVVVVRERLDRGPLTFLALGAGAPGEAMSTLGLQVAALKDNDQAEAPPAQRAFKISDAFLLIQDNELLVVVDGGLRVKSVETYLRQLILNALGDPNASSFSFNPAANLETERTIETEGIKELELSGTAYAASHELERDGKPVPAFKRMIGSLVEMFQQEANGPAEQEMLADHWGDLRVRTVISVAGGSYGEPFLLESMKEVSKDVIDEEDPQVDISIKTKRNTEIKAGELVLSRNVSLKRRSEANDLVATEVWKKLEEYRVELQEQGGWQR